MGCVTLVFECLIRVITDRCRAEGVEASHVSGRGVSGVEEDARRVNLEAVCQTDSSNASLCSNIQRKPKKTSNYDSCSSGSENQFAQFRQAVRSQNKIKLSQESARGTKIPYCNAYLNQISLPIGQDRPPQIQRHILERTCNIETKSKCNARCSCVVNPLFGLRDCSLGVHNSSCQYPRGTE